MKKVEEQQRKPAKKLEITPKRKTISIGEKTNVSALLKKSDGSTASYIETDFYIKDNIILAFAGNSTQKTDPNDHAVIEIEGKKTGETSVIAKTRIDGETALDEIKIGVSQPK